MRPILHRYSIAVRFPGRRNRVAIWTVPIAVGMRR
jgi:hypothetical protein